MLDAVFQSWRRLNPEAAQRYRPLSSRDWTSAQMTVEAFRQRLCEVAPNATATCAEAAGLSTGQFLEALETGQVTVLGVMRDLIAALEKRP